MQFRCTAERKAIIKRVIRKHKGMTATYLFERGIELAIAELEGA
jgi:hypothetical protein